MLCSPAQLRAEMAAAQQPGPGRSQQAGADSHAHKVSVWARILYYAECDIRCRYTESESGFGVLEGATGLASSLEGKLMIERETLYSQLVEIRGKMVCSIMSCVEPPLPLPLPPVRSGAGDGWIEWQCFLCR